jgi:hypothetical protein
VNIVVNAVPTVTASNTRTLVCKNETTTLTAGGANSYSWTGASGSLGSGSSVTISATSITSLVYTVTGEATTGCKGTAVVIVNVNACNGIDEVQSSSARIMIYPNPNNGEFTIKSDSPADLRIVNEFGQLVKTIKISSSDNEIKVPDLAPGVYFVMSRTINQKLIISK